jgi:hypothetical protein
MQKILTRHLDRLEGCSFPEQFTFAVLSSSAVERSAVNSPRRIAGANQMRVFVTYVLASKITGETYVG